MALSPSLLTVPLLNVQQPFNCWVYYPMLPVPSLAQVGRFLNFSIDRIFFLFISISRCQEVTESKSELLISDGMDLMRQPGLSLKNKTLLGAWQSPSFRRLPVLPRPSDHRLALRQPGVRQRHPALQPLAQALGPGSKLKTLGPLAINSSDSLLWPSSLETHTPQSGFFILWIKWNVDAEDS